MKTTLSIRTLCVCACVSVMNAHLCAQVTNQPDPFGEDTSFYLSKRMDEIVVSAPVVQATISKQEMTHEQLNRDNSGQNLPYLLSTAPSMVVTSDDGLGVGYTYFHVRGTDQTRINMTMNEVPLNDAESQSVFWVNLTDMASGVSSLQVQRGVGTSANGGSSFGASVNLRTLDATVPESSHPGPVRAELDFNGGMYNTFREMVKADVYWGDRMEKKGAWHLGGRFSKVNSDGYIRRATFELSQSLDEAVLSKSEADLDKALEVTTDKSETLYERANLIYNYQLTKPEHTYKDWTYEKALSEIRKALAINDLPAYSQLEADILFAMQNYTEAYNAIEKVNASPLASAATWYNAAHCKELMDAPSDEVIELIDKCIGTFTPPYTEQAAPYLLERARIYSNAEKYRPALIDYDEYYKAVNGKVNDQFYYLRGQCAMQAKAFQRALDDYAEAIEQNPEELTYRAELAVVNMRVGRNDEAIKVLDEAILKDATYAELYRLKGLALLQLKKNKDARSAFDKAKELGDPQVDALIEKYF